MGFTGFKNNNINNKKESFHAADYSGAWRLIPDSQDNRHVQVVKIMSDNYFMVAYYDFYSKKFIKSSGGTYAVNNDTYTETIEFSTADASEVGNSIVYTIKSVKNKLNLINNYSKKQENWEKIVQPIAGNSSLTGDWRIIEREQNGKMIPIQKGHRKTIKILAGSRFQWAAINTDTKEFFGTGGGTYTANNGKYTETIEFFSRDSSRVGNKLSFDFEVKDNNWHHKGLSSTGNKIYEVWTRE
jgi:hypothetical protein